jgi:pimeloyl-ACP methyl ester carboxylesterase
MAEVFDHRGQAVKHGRARVNGIRMHYVTAGEGEPLLLLHGVPKTHFYYCRVIPLLTAHFTIVAPDLRGFGYTDRPPTAEGYDSRTNAKDLEELMTQLGHRRFHVHGEDRGAEFAYALAGLYPERVKTLSFCEMMLSCPETWKRSYFTAENIRSQFEQHGPWTWHVPFFWMLSVPEMLLSGKEREFWTWWIRNETYNPNAIDQECIEEWLARLSAPGGVRGVLESYRAVFKNAELNAQLAQHRLTMPVLTIGAPEFFAHNVEQQMRALAQNVERAEVWEECGHSVALEQPQRLARTLCEFMLKPRD